MSEGAGGGPPPSLAPYARPMAYMLVEKENGHRQFGEEFESLADAQRRLDELVAADATRVLMILDDESDVARKYRSDTQSESGRDEPEPKPDPEPEPPLTAA